MRILLALIFFMLPIFAAQAQANGHDSDKINTLNRIIDDPGKPGDCSENGGRIICAHTLYHYELDEHGKLYFVKLTAYGVKGDNTLQPGPSSFSFICQLNSTLGCELPALGKQLLDLSAYAITPEGVLVHTAVSPWENPQKAALFLGQLKSDTETAITAGAHSQSRMMDDLVCYMFDFNALVAEYKTNSRIVEDRSIQKLRPENCLASFETICSDPGSRADELELANEGREGHPGRPKKLALKSADISHFCNSLKETKSVMAGYGY